MDLILWNEIVIWSHEYFLRFVMIYVSENPFRSVSCLIDTRVSHKSELFCVRFGRNVSKTFIIDNNPSDCRICFNSAKTTRSLQGRDRGCIAWWFSLIVKYSSDLAGWS